jgi:hypothetical protein
MKYYKKLDINGWQNLSSEALTYVLQHPNIYNRSAKISLMEIELPEALYHMPSLNIFDVYDIKVSRVLFYVMYDNSNSGIHSDCWPHNARINVPVLNCQSTYITFWSEVIWKDSINAGGQPLKIAVADCGKFEGMVEVDMPIVLLVNEPHKTIINKNKNRPRITLSLDFDKCPSFLIS